MAKWTTARGSDLSVLTAILENGPALSYGEIADEAGISPRTAAAAVRRLIQSRQLSKQSRRGGRSRNLYVCLVRKTEKMAVQG